MATPLIALVAIFAGIIALVLGVLLAVKLASILGWIIGHIFRFVWGMISDVFRIVGALILAIVLIPLALASIIIGRWSASAHFFRSSWHEFETVGVCAYRVVIGHPARLLGLGQITEGLEKRLPQVVAETPGRDRPSKRGKGRATGLFEGYEILGSLPGGGSGGKLYIAEPDEIRKAAFERRGFGDINKVVIKTFSLEDGSSLPQIVRESRALDAARKLGLVLDHELSDERFHYIMRHVPGESLAIVTTRMHGMDGTEGLSNKHLDASIGYITDLLESLITYHRGGLWHKDVKPDNIIVDGRQAHLVDFGLITPLRSAMTLTTHGTEYFRDPELVRQALRGVKVHQIDGAKFDVYATGAVLFSVIENSFPAHGGLSQISKKCPDALRWIVRRSMTDYDQRYTTAEEMLADLIALQQAEDPYAMRPADLPSMSGGAPAPKLREPEIMAAAFTPAPRAPQSPPVDQPAAVVEAPLPSKIRLTNWWSGAYTADDDRAASHTHRPGPRPAPARPEPAAQARASKSRTITPVDQRRPAHEQVERARARAQARRDQIGNRKPGRPARMAHAAPRGRSDNRTGRRSTATAALGLGFVLLVGAGIGLAVFTLSGQPPRSVTITHTPPVPAYIPDSPKIAVVPPIAPIKNHTDAALLTAGQRLERAAQLLAAHPHGHDLSDALVSDIHDVFTGNMLLVSDLTPPIDEEIRTRVDRTLRIFTTGGLHLEGNVFDPESALEDGTIDTLASVRQARGQASLDSGEFIGRVSRWLQSQNDLDFVTWIGRTAENAEGLRVSVIGRQATVTHTGNGDPGEIVQNAIIEAFTSRE